MALVANEASLMRKIQIRASEWGSRLFRNNVGCYRIGQRFIRYGLGGNGGSDLIGFTSVTITPQMVGQTVAIFTAVEVKAGSRTTKEQCQFLQGVIKAGGIGLIARSIDDVEVAIIFHK